MTELIDIHVIDHNFVVEKMKEIVESCQTVKYFSAMWHRMSTKTPCINQVLNIKYVLESIIVFEKS